MVEGGNPRLRKGSFPPWEENTWWRPDNLLGRYLKGSHVAEEHFSQGSSEE